MGLFKTIKSKFRNEVETINTNPTLEELQEFFGISIGDISSSKLNSVSYYSCMQIRCNAIAKLPIKLLRESDKGIEKATDNTLYNVLKKRPNSFTNAHDFIWATEFQRLEYGNAFWVMDYDRRGNIVALYLLDSSKVNIIVDNTEILDSKNSVYYIYNDPIKGQLIYTNDNIVHFKNFSMKV